jgi:hypothetical protein
MYRIGIDVQARTRAHTQRPQALPQMPFRSRCGACGSCSLKPATGRIARRCERMEEARASSTRLYASSAASPTSRLPLILACSMLVCGAFGHTFRSALAPKRAAEAPRCAPWFPASHGRSQSAQARTHARTHVRAHARTHARMHARARTHTHTSSLGAGASTSRGTGADELAQASDSGGFAPPPVRRGIELARPYLCVCESVCVQVSVSVYACARRH